MSRPTTLRPAPQAAVPAAKERRAVRAAPGWGVPAALIVLSLIPVSAGCLRLIEVAGGPVFLPSNPRIDRLPAPVVVHVVAATLYALVGSLQFSARLRRRRPHWHRGSGRMLVVAGMLVAVSGLWMTLLHAGAPGGDLLRAVRILVAIAMAASIVLGIAAVRRRDIPAHRAWMIRAYALAVAAGTQAFTEGIGEAVLGTGDRAVALSLSAGWAINAAVAEVVVRSRAGRSAHRSPAAGGPS